MVGIRTLGLGLPKHAKDSIKKFTIQKFFKKTEMAKGNCLLEEGSDDSLMFS